MRKLDHSGTKATTPKMVHELDFGDTTMSATTRKTETRSRATHPHHPHRCSRCGDQENRRSLNSMSAIPGFYPESFLNQVLHTPTSAGRPQR
jgi:hypothetical protein